MCVQKCGYVDSGLSMNPNCFAKYFSAYIPNNKGHDINPSE